MTKQETIKVLKNNLYLERTMAKRPGISRSARLQCEKAIDAYSAAIKMLERC